MYEPFPQLTPSVAVPPPSRTGRWIAAGIVAALLLVGAVAWVGIGEYNKLQNSEAAIGYRWNQVINQYMRRSDLVPNLVTVVRSYATHESQLLSQVAATRSRLDGLAAGARDGGDPQQVAQFQAAQRQLSSQLGRLLLVAERYPDLKSANLYQDLMVQLEGTENRLAYAREQYFLSLTDYNFGLRRFPSNLVASYIGMREKQPVALADDRVVRPAAPLDLK